MYEVFLGKRVQKQLVKIAEPDLTRIKKIILELERNPRPFGCKKLKGRSGYRLRQGNYRVVYEIHDHVLRIIVIDIGDRKDIYQ